MADSTPAPETFNVGAFILDALCTHPEVVDVSVSWPGIVFVRTKGGVRWKLSVPCHSGEDPPMREGEWRTRLKAYT